jgi:light-independent protochlorophyllide reductase subunit B
VIFDSWVHPLMMGLEEHLLTMFREDFEFHDSASASHLCSEGHGPRPQDTAAAPGRAEPGRAEPGGAEPGRAEPGGAEPGRAEPGRAAPGWAREAERELHKIPFFVRGKARRNTERFALEQGVSEIDVETLYEAKAHYSR